MLKNNVKVLVFAGDVDFICNYLGNKEYLMQTMPKSFGFQSAKDVEIHTESGQKIGLLRESPTVPLTFIQVLTHLFKSAKFSQNFVLELQVFIFS